MHMFRTWGAVMWMSAVATLAAAAADQTALTPTELRNHAAIQSQ